MAKLRRIIMLIYDGFELLDLSGPASVYTAANAVGKMGGRSRAYDLITVSVSGGEICSNAGVKIVSQPISVIQLCANDTVLVVGAGGQAIKSAMSDQVLGDWLKRAANSVDRYGSVCTGAFVLAAAGLLAGRKATTHWAGCKILAGAFPSVNVKPDALYVTDGNVWTSAGVTTGIDMALEMVARDHGAELMGTIAKWLVVYAHRPGNQSQFSTVLSAQTAAGGLFTDVISWMGKNLEQPIRLADMAEQAGMTERTFRRKFTAKIGVSPSKYLEGLRLEKAKKLLEAKQPIGSVISAIGYRSEASFRTAFRGKFGITPSVHAVIHCQDTRP